jgi:hypothetical protein
LVFSQAGWHRNKDAVAHLAGMTSVFALAFLNSFTILPIKGAAGCSVARSSYSFRISGSK